MDHFIAALSPPYGACIHLEVAVDLGEADPGGVLEGAVGLAPRPHQAPP